MPKDTRSVRQYQLQSSRNQSTDYRPKVSLFSFPNMGEAMIDDEALEDDHRRTCPSNCVDGAYESDDTGYFSDILCRLIVFALSLFPKKLWQRYVSPQNLRTHIYNFIESIRTVWVWRVLMVMAWVAAFFVNCRGSFADLGLSPVYVETFATTTRFMLLSSESKFWSTLTHGSCDVSGDITGSGNACGGLHSSTSQDFALSTPVNRRPRSGGVGTLPLLPSQALLQAAKLNGVNVTTFNARISRTSRLKYYSFFSHMSFCHEMAVYFIMGFFFFEPIFLQRLILGLFFANSLQWTNFSSSTSLMAAVLLLVVLLFFQVLPEGDKSLLNYAHQHSSVQQAYLSYSFALSLTGLLTNTFIFLEQRAALVEFTTTLLHSLQRVQHFVFRHATTKSSSCPAVRGHSWFDLILFLAFWYTITMGEWSLDIPLFAMFYFILVAPKAILCSIRSANQNHDNTGLSTELLVYFTVVLWLCAMVPLNELQTLSRMMRTALIIILIVFQRIEKLTHASSEIYMCLWALLMGFEFFYFPHINYSECYSTSVMGQKLLMSSSKSGRYVMDAMRVQRGRGYVTFLNGNLVAFGTVYLYTLAGRRNELGKGRKDRHQRSDPAQPLAGAEKPSLKGVFKRLWPIWPFSRAAKSSKEVPSAALAPAALNKEPSIGGSTNSRRFSAGLSSPPRGVGGEDDKMVPFSSSSSMPPTRTRIRAENNFSAEGHAVSGKTGSAGRLARMGGNGGALWIPAPVTVVKRSMEERPAENPAEDEPGVSPETSICNWTTEIVSVGDTLKLGFLESSSEFPTTAEDAESTCSEESFSAPDVLATDRKALPKKEKQKNHGGLEPTTCPYSGGITSASSLVTGESDLAPIGYAQTSLKEALTHDNNRKALSEPCEGKNEGENALMDDTYDGPTLATSANLLPKVASSPSVECVSFTCTSQSGVSTQGWKSSKENRRKSEEVSVVATEDGSDSSDMKKEKRSEVMDQLPPQRQPNNLEQRKWKSFDSKSSEEEKQTKEQDQNHQSNLIPSRVAYPMKKESAKQPLPSMGAKVVVSPPSLAKLNKPSGGWSAAPSAGAKTLPFSVERPPQTTKFVLEFLANAKLIQCEDVSPMKDLPLTKQRDSSSNGGRGGPLPVVECESTPNHINFSHHFPKDNNPLDSAAPPLTGGGKQQALRELSSFSSLGNVEKAENSVAYNSGDASETTAQNTSNYAPLYFSTSSTQVGEEPKQHVWEPSELLGASSYEEKSKKSTSYSNLMDLKIRTESTEPPTIDTKLQICTTNTPSELALDLNFDNEEGIAELLSVVAKITPKTHLDSKEELLNIDTLPFFSGFLHPFATESNQQPAQYPVGVVEQAVATIGSDTTAELCVGQDYFNANNCFCFSNEWPNSNSDNIQLGSVGGATGENSPSACRAINCSFANSTRVSYNVFPNFEQPQFDTHFSTSSQLNPYLYSGELSCRAGPGVVGSGDSTQASLALPPQMNSNAEKKASLSTQRNTFSGKQRASRSALGEGSPNIHGSYSTAHPLPGACSSTSQYASAMAQQQQLQRQQLQQQPPSHYSPPVKHQGSSNPLQMIPLQPEQFIAVPLADGRMGFMRVVQPVHGRYSTDPGEMPMNAPRMPTLTPLLGTKMAPFPVYGNPSIPLPASVQKGLH